MSSLKTIAVKHGSND